MEKQKVILVSEEFYEFVEANLQDSIFTPQQYFRMVLRECFARDFGFNPTVVPKP